MSVFYVDNENQNTAAERKCPRVLLYRPELLLPPRITIEILRKKISIKQDFVFYRPLFKSVVVEIPGDYSGVPLKTALLKKRKKI